MREAGGGYRAIPARNVAANRRHRFEIDPTALLLAAPHLAGFYHSHVDAPAELSAADRAGLVADGRPSWPGLTHVIVGVRAGRAVELRAFVWDDAASGFTGVPLDSAFPTR